MPVALAVVGDVYPAHRRARALGALAAIETLGWVWGPLGMFLSVPLTMVVKILLEHSDDLRWAARDLEESRGTIAELERRLESVPELKAEVEKLQGELEAAERDAIANAGEMKEMLRCIRCGFAAVG